MQVTIVRIEACNETCFILLYSVTVKPITREVKQFYLALLL